MGCCPVLQLGKGRGLHFMEGWERGAIPPPSHSAAARPLTGWDSHCLGMLRHVSAMRAPRVSLPMKKGSVYIRAEMTTPGRI